MASIEIPPEETKELAAKDDAADGYRIRVVDAGVRISHARDKRFTNDGILYEKGFNGEIANLEGEAVYAYNPSSTVTATVEIDDNTFGLATGFLESISGDVQVSDSSNATIDPATEDTLAALAAALESNGTDRLQTTASVSTNPNQPNLATGEDTVATAGTAVQLNGGTSQAVPDSMELAIKALDTNAGDVYVGGSTVDASTGAPLSAGETMSLAVSDVANVYLDADNDGEGVRWIAEVA